MTPKTAGKTATPRTARSPRNGAEIPLGNHPGNTGGKPGRSGRRPTAIAVAAREICERYELLDVAARIATTAEKESDRLAAIRFLHEYGYGRPTQLVEHTGPEGGPIPLDLSRLKDRELAQLETLLARATQSN